MPNKELDNFLKYLQNERQASVHTTESYRMDIEQFAKMILKKDIVDNPDSANWASVNVFSARMFVLELQKEELTKTMIPQSSQARGTLRYLKSFTVAASA